MTGKAMAFIYEDDQRSIIIFGHYFERYELPEILKNVAVALPDRQPDYRGEPMS